MVLTITGPKKPIKHDLELKVDLSRVSEYEGLFDDSRFTISLANYNALNGYHDGNWNEYVYDNLWGKVFTSLTGEKLEECVNIWLLPEDVYEPIIIETFGSRDVFKEFTGFYPEEIQ